MKYLDEKAFSKINLEYRDQKIRNRIREDDFNKAIHWGRQGKHILGHNNYVKGKSYLTISNNEIEETVKKYAGTGRIVRDRKGRWTNKEKIQADKLIGVYVDLKSKEHRNTKGFTISYSKKGVHIVPRKED